MRKLVMLLYIKISLLPFPLLAQTDTKLQGRVTGKDDIGLVGATVLLEPDQKVVQTDESGGFMIQRLYAGTYHLRVTCVGYEPYYQEVVIKDNQLNNLQVNLKSTNKELQAAQVTGLNAQTDNLMKIERSAMPITIINREQIELMGSRRLDEVLKEQTGIALVNDIGGGSRAVGIQMQGFSSQYIMVLVDGQPMVGRNNGNLDLSRISVSNVERIEIIKGATSCLYGSEALGGAINIITRHGAIEPQAKASLFYGSLNMIDATLEGETPFRGQRGAALISANYYRLDGYNTNPYITNGQTIPPYDNYALQSRLRYRVSKANTLILQGRYNLRRSVMQHEFNSNDIININENKQRDEDLNLTAGVNSNFGNGVQAMTRYYYTHYNTEMEVLRRPGNIALSSLAFAEQNHRLEQQLAFPIGSKGKFTAGAGGNIRAMRDNALAFGADPLYNYFAYMQGDWNITEKLSAMGGLRYDHTGGYGGKLIPSVGVQYQLNALMALKAGVGGGFIAPDFQKRFLVFTNLLQGYTVIGSEVLRNGLEELHQAGEISEVREYLVNQLAGKLRPERSTSYNAGIVLTPMNRLRFEANVFYHQLHDFINTIQVATKTNGQQVFSYQNIASSYNTGLELSLSLEVLDNLTFNAGYQYLIVKDKGVKDSIRNGVYPYDKIRNGETGETRNATVGDYFGLENRSRHMVNANLVYRYPRLGLNATLRANYRSKYGWGDSNSNQFLDRYDTFVDGFVLLYASVEKKFKKDRFGITLTGENLLNYTDYLMPGQMGRMVTAGLTYRFFRN